MSVTCERLQIAPPHLKSLGSFSPGFTCPPHRCIEIRFLLFFAVLFLVGLAMAGPPWHLIIIIMIWLAQGLHELHHSAKSAARRRIYPGLFSSLAFVTVQACWIFPLWWDAVVGTRGSAFTSCILVLPLVWIAFYVEDRDWIFRTPQHVWDQPAITWSWKSHNGVPASCHTCDPHWHGGLSRLGAHTTAQEVVDYYGVSLAGVPQ